MTRTGSLYSRRTRAILFHTARTPRISPFCPEPHAAPPNPHHFPNHCGNCAVATTTREKKVSSARPRGPKCAHWNRRPICICMQPGCLKNCPAPRQNKFRAMGPKSIFSFALLCTKIHTARGIILSGLCWWSHFYVWERLVCQHRLMLTNVIFACTALSSPSTGVRFLLSGYVNWVLAPLCAWMRAMIFQFSRPISSVEFLYVNIYTKSLNFIINYILYHE